MNHQRKSSKVTQPLNQVFKVALSMHREWITNQTVEKLWSLYIKYLKLTVVYISRADHKTKSSKVPESLYKVFRAALSKYHEWITKIKVVMLRSLYIEYLKCCCLCIMSGSPKEKVVKLHSLYIKCLKLRCLCIQSGSPKKKL